MRPRDPRRLGLTDQGTFTVPWPAWEIVITPIQLQLQVELAFSAG